ncbi:Ig-like domain-containing protein, partial [Klebsiella pneumoniae]
KPEITAPKAGDKEIKGKAEPNAKVVVELPDGTKVETTADKDGNFTAKVPEGKEPKEGETVKATATVDGKKPSEEATATTGKADP